MFKQSDNKGAEPARNCAELGFEQTRQAGVARALTSAVLFVSCGSLNSVNLSSTLSMSVLEYWNSLFCALNTMRATSQSHNTLSSTTGVSLRRTHRRTPWSERRCCSLQLK